MTYTGYSKLEQLQKKLGISTNQIEWLPATFLEVKPSSILLQYLADAKLESLRTEKAKSEYVIAPIIKELRRNNPNRFSSFSGFELSVDKSLGLTGFCDFVLSSEPFKAEITAPLNILQRYAKFRNELRPQDGMDYANMVDAHAWVRAWVC